MCKGPEGHDKKYGFSFVGANFTYRAEKLGGGDIKSLLKNLVSKHELSTVVPRPGHILHIIYRFLSPSSCRNLGIILVASLFLIPGSQYLSTLSSSHHPHAYHVCVHLNSCYNSRLMSLHPFDLSRIHSFHTEARVIEF